MGYGDPGPIPDLIFMGYGDPGPIPDLVFMGYGDPGPIPDLVMGYIAIPDQSRTNPGRSRIWFLWGMAIPDRSWTWSLWGTWRSRTNRGPIPGDPGSGFYGVYRSRTWFLWGMAIPDQSQTWGQFGASVGQSGASVGQFMASMGQSGASPSEPGASEGLSRAVPDLYKLGYGVGPGSHGVWPRSWTNPKRSQTWLLWGMANPERSRTWLSWGMVAVPDQSQAIPDLVFVGWPPSWPVFAPILARLGSILAHLGQTLAPSWLILEAELAGHP